MLLDPQYTMSLNIFSYFTLALFSMEWMCFVLHVLGGKSALMLHPALARKEMINVIVEPPNVLENDMVCTLYLCCTS